MLPPCTHLSGKDESGPFNAISAEIAACIYVIYDMFF